MSFAKSTGQTSASPFDDDDEQMTIDLTEIPGGVWLGMPVENTTRCPEPDPSADYSSFSESELILLDFFRGCPIPFQQVIEIDAPLEVESEPKYTPSSSLKTASTQFGPSSPFFSSSYLRRPISPPSSSFSVSSGTSTASTELSRPCGHRESHDFLTVKSKPRSGDAPSDLTSSLPLPDKGRFLRSFEDQARVPSSNWERDELVDEDENGDYQFHGTSGRYDQPAFPLDEETRMKQTIEIERVIADQLNSQSAELNQKTLHLKRQLDHLDDLIRDTKERARFVASLR